MGVGWGWEAEGDHRRVEIRVFYLDLLSPLVMGAESEEKPQQVVSYRAGGETWALDLKEWRER